MNATRKIDPAVARDALSKISDLEPSDLMSPSILTARHGLPESVMALGDTEHGWRGDAMLRGLYGSLDAAGRDWAEGDDVVFPFLTWQMMTGEIVTL